MKVLILDDRYKKMWDDFVFAQKGSTFFHQLAWKKVIENTYGHKGIYLIAVHNSEIVGILPLFFIKSKFFGNYLVSTPFGIYGGIVYKDEKAKKILKDHAVKIGNDLNVDYIQFKNVNRENIDGFEIRDLFVTSVLDLHNDYDTVVSSFSKNKKSTINKSQKRNLEMCWECSIEDFYSIYSRNMHKLGTPQHSIELFYNLKEFFPKTCKILGSTLDKKTIYAGVFLIFKDKILDSWSSAIREYRKYYCTDFAINNIIKWCFKNNIKKFDFGRSIKNSSNLEFKLRWKANTFPLFYSYKMNNNRLVPLDDYSNSKTRYVKLWRKMPFFVTKKIGPLIRRYIP